MLRFCRIGLVACLFLVPNLAVGQDDVRVWRDNTGKFSVAATFVGVKEGRVQLRRADTGQMVAVPIIRLSDADRLFLIDMRREQGAQGTSPGSADPAQPADRAPPAPFRSQPVPESTQPIVPSPQTSLPPENPGEPVGQPTQVPPVPAQPAVPESKPPGRGLGQPSTAEIQMPSSNLEAARQPPISLPSERPGTTQAPLAQQPPGQTPVFAPPEHDAWQPPSSEFVPPRAIPELQANSEPPEFTPPKQPPAVTRTPQIDRTTPELVVDDQPAPELPQQPAPDMPAEYPDSGFVDNDASLQRSIGDMPAPSWSGETRATINDLRAAAETPDAQFDAPEFQPPGMESMPAPVPNELPSPLEMSQPDAQAFQPPDVDDAMPEMLPVPELPEMPAESIAKNNPPAIGDSEYPPMSELDPPAEPDTQPVTPDVSDAASTPPDMNARENAREIDPPLVSAESGQPEPPAVNPGLPPANLNEQPGSEPLVMEQPGDEPEAMDPAASEPVEPSVLPPTPGENIAESSPRDRPSVPEFRGRAPAPPAFDQRDDLDLESMTNPVASGGGSFTPPSVTPRVRSETVAINSAAISLSMVEGNADLVSATDEELLEQITMKSLVRWKGTARLSALLEPQPPNMEIVINATGDILESVSHVGFVEFSAVEDVNGQSYRPTVLPPRVANAMDGWIRVTPNGGQETQDSFRQLLLPEVSAAVEFDRPVQLPKSLTSVVGKMRIRMGTTHHLLTINDVVNNAGLVEHPLLVDKGVEVAIRMADAQSLIVEVRGQASEIVGIGLNADISDLVGQNQTDGFRATFYQFNFRSRIPEQVGLEIMINDQGRELEIPFEFVDLQLPLEENRENTQLMPAVDR